MSDYIMPIDIRQITTGQAGAGTRRTDNSTSNQVSADGKSNTVATTTQQDSVELSDKAQLVKSLLSDLSSRSQVNQSRVEQIRTSIASGEFSVSADKIASKMLDLDLGLRKLGR